VQLEPRNQVDAAGKNDRLSDLKANFTLTLTHRPPNDCNRNLKNSQTFYMCKAIQNKLL